MSATKQACRGSRTFSLDGRGRLVALTERGRTTGFVLDGDQRLIRITDCYGTVHELPWEPGRAIVEGVNPGTGFPVFWYEGNEPPAYDLPALTADWGNGLGITTYVYDETGRILEIQEPAGGIRTVMDIGEVVDGRWRLRQPPAADVHEQAAAERPTAEGG